jgi:hypothetical protein
MRKADIPQRHPARPSYARGDVRRLTEREPRRTPFVGVGIGKPREVLLSLDDAHDLVVCRRVDSTRATE